MEATNSDTQLWKNFIQGDTAALEGLYEAHYKRVFSYCYAYLEEVKDSEDLTHDIFKEILLKRK